MELQARYLRFFSLFSAGLIILCAAVPLIAVTFQEDYDQTYRDFQTATDQNSKEKLRTCAERFHELSQRDDAGSLRANCIYWQGQCLYQMGSYLPAMQVFERVLTLPGSNKEEAARFKVVQCLIRLKWKKEAQWEFDRFGRDYTQSALMATLKAEMKILK